MKKLQRFTIVVLLVFLWALMLSVPAQAGISCHNINAKGVGHEVGPFATEATIMGGGLLHGTTAAQFSLTGGAPPVLSFDGPIVFTVNRATLTVLIDGTINVVTGAFSAFGDVSAATGKLEGATGTLFFDGVQNLDDGTFTETVTGQICVDLSP